MADHLKFRFGLRKLIWHESFKTNSVDGKFGAGEEFELTTVDLAKGNADIIWLAG